MLIAESKIVVCCSHSVTGGPELLHQLVNELRNNGRNAVICYYPFDKDFHCPEPYKKYNAPQGKLEDNSDTFIIFPESATRFIKGIKKARVGVWWLSVDNYFLATHKSKLIDFYVRFKSLIRARVPLFKLRNIVHFTQSHYAEEFLKRNSISSFKLTDYLGDAHLANPYAGDAQGKDNVVVYNPKKGKKETDALIKAYQNIKFIPIENMTAAQVAGLLKKAKVYIDFGHHPGKDRPPREAAMAGCCVITGKRGSAKYYEDVPIPEKYKLDDIGNCYISEFGPLVSSIFNKFDVHSLDFAEYRARISEEPEIFRSQVKEIFG